VGKANGACQKSQHGLALRQLTPSMVDPPMPLQSEAITQASGTHQKGREAGDQPRWSRSSVVVCPGSNGRLGGPPSGTPAPFWPES
jgi:hypothetical protein